MALTRIFFTTSLLLVSLLILVSAGDYGYSTNPEGDDSQSSAYKSYVEKSKPEQNGYDYKIEGKGYDFKQKVEKYKPKEKGYGSKPDGNGYGSKPYTEKSKSEDKGYETKPESNKYGSNGNGYGRKVDFEKSKSVEYHSEASKPNYSKDYNSKPTNIDFGRKSAPTGY